MSRGLAAVLAAAAAARTAAVVWAPEPGLRFAKFEILADRLRASGWLPTEPFAYSPAYTYLVALVRAVVGDGDLALAAVQVSIDCATVAAVFSLARSAFGARAAVLAGLGAALARPLVQYAIAFESDGLGTALLMVGAAVAATAMGDGAGWRFAAAGAVLGLRVCQRPNGVLAVAVVVAVVAFAGWCPRRRRRAAASLLVAAGAAVPVAAVVTVNARAAGELVPVMSSAGWVLYTSHNHVATGLGYAPPPLALELKRDRRLDPVVRMDDAVSRRIATWVVGRPLGAAGSSAFWRREAVARIAERGAVGQLRLQLDRLWFAIHAYDAHDNAALVAQDERMRGWPLLGAGLIAPLGLAGLGRWLVRGRPGGPPAALAAWLLAVPAVSLSIFYVIARFRLELIALLLPFAAWGVVDVIADRRRRTVAGDLVWVATAAVALVAAHLPSEAVETHRRRAWIRLETVRGDSASEPRSSAFHYRRASEMARYPAEAATADERLAATLADLDAPAAAQRARLRAAGVLPAAEVATLTRLDRDPEALWAIGRYRLATGDPAGAAAAFDAAYELRPLDPEIGFSLAVALDARGRADPRRVRGLAADALRHGLRFSSDAPRAWRLVARQELALGRAGAAAAASLEAARLESTLPLPPRPSSSR